MPSPSSSRWVSRARFDGIEFLRKPWLAVAGGGLLGSAARTGVSFLFPTTPGSFPMGVLSVNLGGSLLLGNYLVRSEQAVAGPASVPFWAIGVFGSFTTFSAFSLDVVLLLEAGRRLAAGGYVLASIVGGLGLALGGQWLGSAAKSVRIVESEDDDRCH